MTPTERDAIPASVFPPDTTVDPCPKCGRLPSLHRDRTIARFECWPWWRRLLAIQPCHVGPYVVCSLGDVEQERRAAGAWNRSVSDWRDS